MTRAPQSARCRLASGAAMACSSDTTVMPDNGSCGDSRFMDDLRREKRDGRWCRSKRPLALRQSLEARHALGNMVEGLLVDGVDRHLRAAEQPGIVERADFQN